MNSSGCELSVLEVFLYVTVLLYQGLLDASRLNGPSI